MDKIMQKNGNKKTFGVRQDEVTNLMNIGIIAWTKIGEKARVAYFKYKGKKLKIVSLGFRLVVRDMKNNNIAHRWI